ncbi:MAG: hypothetical protein GF334_03960, partial [Candidatus Altiarchaeales archaeon]|nr:hypothetical protein [Candidatus Altiarchaeales archaeon]
MDSEDGCPWEIPQRPGEQTNKNHLLGLICELKSVSVLAASYKLETPIDVVSVWAKELESDGLISVDYQGVDPIYTITSAGQNKLMGIEKDLREEQRQRLFESYSTPIDSNISGKSRDFRGMLQKIVSAIPVRYDFFALISILISLRLFYLFIRDPNTQVYSFFFGSLLFSATVFFYRKYRRIHKSDESVDFIQWLPNFIVENRVYITTILIAFSLVYVLGLIWLNPSDLPFYLLLAVFLVSIAVLP